MAKYLETIDIAASPEAVWALLADLPHWPQWTPTVTAVEPLGSGDLVLGAGYRLRQPRLPAVVWTVDTLEPGRAFSWRASSPGVRSHADHRVEPAPTGCRALLSFEQSGPLARLSAVFYARLIRRYVRTEAAGLKRHAERHGAQPG